MKNRAKFSSSMALCCVLSVIAAVQVVVADSASQNQDQTAPASARTAFIYQGQLRDTSGPVNGLFDVRFSLYTTQAGEQSLQSVEHDGLALTNGLFSLQLDFGAIARELSEGWLEIAVRAHGSADSYIVLTPRQKLTSTPYAIWTQAESWSLIGVPIGFPGGADSDTVLTDGMADQAGADAKKIHGQTMKDKNSLEDHVAPEAATAAALATAGSIPKFTGVFNQIAESVMFDINGNIGIGTTSPEAKLSIAATGNGARVLHLGTERAWVFKQLGTGAATALELTAADSTNNNKHFVINTDGNVGIGTTSPGSKLDVAGTAQLRGAAGGTGLFVNSSGNVGIKTTNPLRAVQIGPSPDAAFTIEPSDGSPRAGFIRFGDKTGWRLHFARSRERSAGPLNTGITGNLMELWDDGTFRLVGFPQGATGVQPLCRTLSNVITMCPSSSLRYKTDIEPYRRGLDVIDRLQPIAFTRKLTGTRDVGLAAEDVEQIEPLLTFRNEKDEIEGVKYELLTVVLVNAIKQQQEQLQQQQHLIEQLQSRLTRLERGNKQR
jgi:hypothetical protein